MRTIARCHNCGSLMRLCALDDEGRQVHLCTRSLVKIDCPDRPDMIPCDSLYMVIAGRLEPVSAVLIGGQTVGSPLISSFGSDFQPRPMPKQVAVQEGRPALATVGVEPRPKRESVEVAV